MARPWAVDERWLFAASALGGVILIVLSFLPWVRYEFPADVLCRGRFCHPPASISQVANGFEVEGLTDFGDAYLIAAAGALILVVSGIALVKPSLRLVALPVLAAGAAAFGIALFDTLRDFKAPCSGPGVSNISRCVDGDPTVALWVVAGLGLLVAMLAATSLLEQTSQSAGPARVDTSQ
jgi:ABC-type Fe3+-siderophore transport system permease subunit